METSVGVKSMRLRPGTSPTVRIPIEVAHIDRNTNRQLVVAAAAVQGMEVSFSALMRLRVAITDRMVLARLNPT